jgi:selenide,water dikinase
LLVGISTGDDAGVYRLTPDLALVNTVDFFTPVVDDPFTYGQIAAANAMSDIYAMGGTPRTALNIVCWPQSGLPQHMLGEILRGGAEKAQEAGAVIVGGHTVADEEVKYGMAVTGIINPNRIIRNVGAKVGDVLVLTKALGTGVLMTAFKRDRLAADFYEAAVRSMTELNAAASIAMLRYKVHAATDITGFGLIGHAAGMAQGGGVTLVFEESDLPLLPGALELCRRAQPPVLRAIDADQRRDRRGDGGPGVRPPDFGRTADRAARNRRHQAAGRPPASRQHGGGNSRPRRAARRSRDQANLKHIKFWNRVSP